MVEDRKEITPEEAIAIIRSGRRLERVTVKGSIDLNSETLRSVDITVCDIKGCLDLHDTDIGDDGSADYEHPCLSVHDCTIENIYLNGAIINGSLWITNCRVEEIHLVNLWLKSEILLVDTKVRLIEVDQDNAQLVHWAAPTTPLLVTKSKS